MRRSTHIHIANQIISETGIDPYSNEAKCLRQGSTVPDDWKDYPHHYGKDSLIRKRIADSRKAWLNGQKEESCFHLGVAFHYLADKWTLMNGSDRRHSSWERSIDGCSLYEDVNSTIRYSGMSDDKKAGYFSTLGKINKPPLGKNETLVTACVNRPTNWSTPTIDLNMAYRICLATAQSVFSPTTAPSDVQKKIDLSSKIAENLLSTARFQIAWFILVTLALGFMIPLSATNSIILLLFVLLLFLEGYVAGMFFLKGFSSFKKVQAFHGIISAWILIIAVMFIVGCYAGIVLSSGAVIAKISVVTVTVCLFTQSLLQFTYLNGKSKMHELFTYTDWFNDSQEAGNNSFSDPYRTVVWTSSGIVAS